MLQLVQATLARHRLIPDGATVLVAVSGGADSMALLDVLNTVVPRRRWRLAVAHLHHGIRGRSADEDTAFVKRQARTFGLRAIVGRADVPALARRRGISVEMAAREARYDFLARTAKRMGAAVVATAHTADDQAETILLKLLRGAGPEGLSGMPYATVLHDCQVVRPLLDVRRPAILAYLRQRGVPWREDDSNRDVAFLRNRVRHELLPLLETRFNPQVRTALTRLGRIMEAENEWLDALTKELMEGVYSADGRGGLSCSALRNLPLAARRRVVRLWLARSGVPQESLDFDAVERVQGLVEREGGQASVSLAGGWAVRRRYGTLVIGRNPAEPALRRLRIRIAVPGQTILAELGLKVTVRLEPGLVKERGGGPGILPAGATLSAAPWRRRALYLRTWAAGDRMKPFGMKGTKKVQDILVDAKVPRETRDRVLLIECGGEIVWLPGYRIARGWEIADPTRPNLQVTVEPDKV